MIILPDRTGWLANRVYLFMQFIVFSKQHNIRIWNPGFNEYAEYFETTSQSLVCTFPHHKSVFGNSFFRKISYKLIYLVTHVLIKLKKPMSRFKLFPGFIRVICLKHGEEFSLDSSENIILLKKSGFTILTGWAFRYSDINAIFSQHAVIRDYFKPLHRYQNNIENLFAKIYTENKEVVVIGVHIRRGDYNTFEGGKYFFDVSAYAECMKNCRETLKGKNTVFLVCSNETIDPHAFQSLGLKFYFGTGDKIEDLYSFAKCDYLIGPPSTYTMWASLYGRVPLYMIRDTQRKILLNDFLLPEKWMLPGSALVQP